MPPPAKQSTTRGTPTAQAHADILQVQDKRSLALLAPFPDDAVSKLPKPICRACQDQQGRRLCNQHTWITNCPECRGSHSSATIHLDYVGHADVTRRLLEVDSDWDWQPVTDPALLAVLPNPGGGMWIQLTVNGTTRLGYGDAQGKSGHNAVKEVIGDALRNAAMRFGVGLDLWSKSDAARQRAETEQAHTPNIAPTPPVAAPRISVGAIWMAAELLGKDCAEMTQKFRERPENLRDGQPVSVDELDELDPEALHFYVLALRPFVIAAESKAVAEIEAAERSRHAAATESPAADEAQGDPGPPVDQPA